MRPFAFGRFVRDTSGSLALTFAASGVVLIGATGLGIDVYRTQNTQAGLMRVADATCSAISQAAPINYGTASAIIAMASSFARAELDANTATNGGSVSISQSGGSYQVSLEKQVPATLGAVIGYRGVNAKAGSTCRKSLAGSAACRSNSFLLSAFYAPNYRLGFASLKSASPNGTNTSHFVVTVARLVSNQTIVDSRFLISTDHVIPSTVPNISASSNVFVHNINIDGTIPDFCETAATPPPPPTRLPPTAQPRSCDPTALIGSNSARNRNLKMTARDYSGAVSLSRSGNSMTLAGFPTSDRDALPQSPWAFRLGAKFVASTTTVTITNRAGVDFNDVPLEQAYLYKVGSGHFPNATAYATAGYKLVYVKSTSDAIWEDLQGNCVDLQSPLALDLVGFGEIRTTGEATAFDAVRSKVGRTVTIRTKDGPLAIEWLVGNGQGFLVDNRDGAAASDMTLHRLFGPDGDTTNGFETLRKWDRSGTGVVSGDDLDGLAVWIDDGDGIARPEEILLVRDLGITALSTNWSPVPGPNGRKMQSFAIRNGHMILMEDIWLSKGQPEDPFASEGQPQ